MMFQLIVTLAERLKPLDRKHPGSLGRHTKGGVLTVQNDAMGQGGSEEQSYIGALVPVLHHSTAGPLFILRGNIVSFLSASRPRGEVRESLRNRAGKGVYKMAHL